MAFFDAVSFHDGKGSDAKAARVSASSANRMLIPQRFIQMLRPDRETHGAFAKAPCPSKLCPRGCRRSGDLLRPTAGQGRPQMVGVGPDRAYLTPPNPSASPSLHPC